VSARLFKVHGSVRWTPTNEAVGEDRAGKHLVHFTADEPRVDIFLGQTTEWFTICNTDLKPTGVYFPNASDIEVTYW